MTTHIVEVSSAAEPGDRDWKRVPVEVALDRTRAFELARAISGAGQDPHVRVMREDGVRVLQLSVTPTVRQ